MTLSFKSRSTRRTHFLLRFADAPSDEQVRALLRRGVNFLRYVPDYGYLVAADRGTSFDRSGLLGVGRLSRENKLSPLLGAGAEEPAGFLVEFHPDVDVAEAAALLRDNGMAIQENASVLPGHWLVTGSLEAAVGLAEWDEVAYVFPASRELLRGEPVIACAGAVTALGPVGQYIATVGDGWDGPGQNATQLGYYLAQLTGKLPQDAARAQVLQALQEWTKYVKITLYQATSPSSNRTVNILFASGWHGDSYPFDGPGGILAHTYYPAPPNPESLAGDMHLDADENWGIGTDPDLFSVVLHEAGHALGLGHSDQPGSVMYPYYRRATGLTPYDITSIQQLYAAADSTVAPPPPTPPAPPPPPTNTPDKVAPSLTITYPTSTNVSTSATSIVFQGTATDNVGVTQVTWTTSAGKTGTATGTTYWSTASIPLYQGSNTVTIRAYDAAGNTSWRSVSVTRR